VRTRLGRFMVVLIAGIVIGSLILGVASALTASNFTYAKKKTGYSVIGPSDMLRANSALTWTMTEDGLVGAGCHFATFHLPQASTMVSVSFYETEGVAAPLDLSLFRVHLATGAKSQPPSPVVDTDGTRQTWTLTVPKTWSPVNNAAYEYMLEVCHDGSGVFHGARVKYAYTSAGD
jgi:hypothetical protein